MIDPYAQTLRWARQNYGKPLGQGLWRRVFAESDDFVVKVPFGEWGEYCNDNEAKESSENTEGILAKCETFHHLKTGVILLRMERLVRFPSALDNLPSWTGWIDCQQVGYAKDGRLVAYDWVYPPPGASGARIGR